MGIKKRAQFFITTWGILFFFVTLTVGGCGKKGEDTKGKKSPGVVDVIRLEGGDWGYPSPYTHYSRGPGGFKMCLIFDSLLERDEKGLVPWLAENYEVREKGKRYLFIMREGVFWHDGKPLTVEDVRFSFEYASRYPMTWSYVFNQIQQVEIVDKRKVLVAVREPGASMLYNLGRTRIIPEHIWKKVERPVAFTGPEAVVGSGPYCLTHYSREHGTYRFEAFEHFWGPEQRVKCIEFLPVSETILAFEKGEIDLTRLTPDILPRFQKDPQYKVVKNPSFWGYRLLFNMGRSPVFRERELRQAIRYAIDLEELVKKIARGAGICGSAGILPPDHIMYNPRQKKYAHDLEKAEELLVKCGYDRFNSEGIRINDKGMPLSFQLLCSSREVRMAELLKARLDEAGIRVTVQSIDGKSRDARVSQGEYQLAIIGHGGWGSDADYLRRFAGHSGESRSPSVTGLSGYSNHELNLLLEKQHMEMDGDKRRRLVDTIQELLAEEVPEIPLFYPTDHTVYRPAKYDGWMYMYDHHFLPHSKLSYLKRGR